MAESSLTSFSSNKWRPIVSPGKLKVSPEKLIVSSEKFNVSPEKLTVSTETLPVSTETLQTSTQTLHDSTATVDESTKLNTKKLLSEHELNFNGNPQPTSEKNTFHHFSIVNEKHSTKVEKCE